MKPAISANAARRSLLALLYFCAVSSFGGGILGVAANGAGVPMRYLDNTPFTTFVVPGLVLGIVVGGTHLLAALALRRHGRAGLVLSVVAGFGMLIWVFVEIVLIGEYSFLQAIYFALGVLELVFVFALLGLAPSITPALGFAPTAQARARR